MINITNELRNNVEIIVVDAAFDTAEISHALAQNASHIKIESCIVWKKIDMLYCLLLVSSRHSSRSACVFQLYFVKTSLYLNKSLWRDHCSNRLI